jgi:hypothetical protein
MMMIVQVKKGMKTYNVGEEVKSFTFIYVRVLSHIVLKSHYSTFVIIMTDTDNLLNGTSGDQLD